MPTGLATLARAAASTPPICTSPLAGISPPSTFHRNILRDLIQACLEGREEVQAYTVGWGRKGLKPSRKVDGRWELTKTDGQALTEAGYLKEITSGTVGYKITPAGIRFGMTLVEHTPLDI